MACRSQNTSRADHPTRHTWQGESLSEAGAVCMDQCQNRDSTDLGSQEQAETSVLSDSSRCLCIWVIDDRIVSSMHTRKIGPIGKGFVMEKKTKQGTRFIARWNAFVLDAQGNRSR